MKNVNLLTISFIALLLSPPIFSQRVHVEKLGDLPEMHGKFIMNLQILALEINTMVGSSSFNVGAWGYYELKNDTIQIDYNFQRSIWQFGRIANSILDDDEKINSPGNTELNIGANYYRYSSLHKGKFPVGLSAVTSSYTRRGTEYTSVSTISTMVEGTLKKLKGYRGGLYYKRDLIELDWPYFAALRQIGLYSGMIFTNRRNIFINTDEYGYKQSAFGSSIYFDILTFPIQIIEPVNSNQSSSFLKSIYRKRIPVGGRVGFRFFRTASNEYTASKYGVTWLIEMGYRPTFGGFLLSGVSFNLFYK